MKLETIALLEQVGSADAAPFVPALTDATKDKDPQVRRAASKALDRIVPKAIEDKAKRDISQAGGQTSGIRPAARWPQLLTGAVTSGHFLSASCEV